MASSVVRMDAAAVARLFNSPAGPVMRHTSEVGEQVKQVATRLVGVSDPAQSFSRAGRARHLRDTIVKRFVAGADGPTVWVGSSHPIALIHHKGTQPHVILPKKAKALRFPSRGRIVFAKRVNHPGTRGNPFLVNAARMVGLKVKSLAGVR